VKRIPRDVSVHLFRRAPADSRYLMLRRTPARGGFWQGVTGAPLPGEADVDAAVREVREETGFDVTSTIFALGRSYAYSPRRELAERWVDLYGPGIASVTVVAFAAESPRGADPELDPLEHDGFAWCSYADADARLDWPVEGDALAGRRSALLALEEQLRAES
jgi:lipoyl(octanoyl) transferase